MTESQEKQKENEVHTVIAIHVLSNLQLPMNSVFAFLGSYLAVVQFMVMASQWRTEEYWFWR